MLSPGDVVLHSFDLQHGVDVFEAGSALVNSKLKRLQSMQYAFKKRRESQSEPLQESEVMSLGSLNMFDSIQ